MVRDDSQWHSTNAVVFPFERTAGFVADDAFFGRDFG